MKTVVVIDDSEEDRYLVKRALRRSEVDAKFVEYDSAFSALGDFTDSHRFRENMGAPPPPALVLLDINMPRLGGFEFLERIQAEGVAAGRCVVVMMFTSSNNPSERARAAEFDCVVDYIVKPITAEKIREIAERAEFRSGAVRDQS